MSRDEQLAQNTRNAMSGNWKRRNILNKLLLLLFFGYTVVLVVGVFFTGLFDLVTLATTRVLGEWIGSFFFSLGFIMIPVVAFIFSFTALKTFPVDSRTALRSFLPMGVGAVLLFVSIGDPYQALASYALLEFAAMSMAVGINFAMPHFKSWSIQETLKQRAAWAVVFIAEGLPFLAWGAIVEAVGLQDALFQDGWAPGWFILLAWAFSQYGLVRSRYKMTKRYDALMGITST